MSKDKKTKAPPAKRSPAKKKAIPKKGEGDMPEKQPLLKKLLFGEEKPDLTELEAGSTTILDILSPTAVDTKSRDYIVVDGIFHAYLYVTGYGYSTTVGNGWLSPMVEAGEGVSLNFIIKRQPKDKTLSKIAQTTMINRSRMRDVGDTRQDYEELDSAICRLSGAEEKQRPHGAHDRVRKHRLRKEPWVCKTHDHAVCQTEGQLDSGGPKGRIL